MARKASNKVRKAITHGGSPSAISPAAEFVSGNADLLTEIFLRVPAKSLIRFKSVSKHWLSLISHPQFSTNHSSRNPSPSISGLYFYSDGRLDSVSLPAHQNLPSLSFLDGVVEGNDSKPKILDSCNGLLLCDAGSSREPMYIICNLTTQKYKVLPKPSDLSSRLAMRRDAYLAFDSSKSPHYKVVVVSHYHCTKSEPWWFEIDTYHSQSGNWKKFFPPGTWCGRGVFWRGAIYWLLSDKLMRFEVDAEEMTALPLRRRNLSNKCTRMYFGACCDGLIIIQTRSFCTLELLSLEVGRNTCWWIFKYSMNLATVGSAFPEMGNFFPFNVLCVVKGEKKEDYTLVLAISGEVITYNMKSKTLGVLRDLVLGEVIHEVMNAYAYSFVETLSLV